MKADGLAQGGLHHQREVVVQENIDVQRHLIGWARPISGLVNRVFVFAIESAELVVRKTQDLGGFPLIISRFLERLP